MKRRDLLLGLGLLPAAGLVRSRALAQERWPTRTVTMVVPFPPGGQADLAARPVAAVLERLLGQSVVVENRGGAGGAVGNAAVARAEPDGHTLLMTLEPGDLIATGTPVGVGIGFKPPKYLKAGDTVSVTIEPIGTLTNPVV